MPTNQAKPTSVYGNRLDPDSFRLLNIDIQPQALIGDNVISCRLETHSRVNCPAYFALSYAWDEPQSRSNDAKPCILLNGHQTLVKPNLYDALRRLAGRNSAGSTDYWWIDALSINQTDPTEQAEQVSIMHNIYRKAKMVVVWLEADFSNEAYLVREFLRALLAKYRDTEIELRGSKYEHGFLQQW